MRALGLLSGGLDSSLAVKLIMDQGIEVIAVKFTSPFCNCDSGGCHHAAKLAEKLGIQLINVAKGQEYLDIVREPRFGRGSGMNICIDCRIFLLKKSKEIANEVGASFIFTGEVLGQRPMSQHSRALKLIEKEAGLEGKLLRPLSAKLLPMTEAERMGWVDREKLMGISGRGRRPQIELAADRGIVDYPCPAGGCLLTSKEFSSKLRDHLEHHPDRLNTRDVSLLKVGRHFRVDGHKVIIGRDKDENDRLRSLCGSEHVLLEPISTPGPVCLCESDDPDVLSLVSTMVARFSDNDGKNVSIKARSDKLERSFDAEPIDPNKLNAYRIGEAIITMVHEENVSEGSVRLMQPQ